MKTLRLRYIDAVDFRASEMTNYMLALRKQPSLGRFKSNDAVLFLSKKRDQLIFVYGFFMTNGEDGVRRFLRSERLRLDGGTWDALMLQNYANDVGIRLEGIKTFEEHLKAAKKVLRAELLRRK
jgi:hypothetical protein